MKRLFFAALAAIGLAVPAAQAATVQIAPVGVTTVTVTADLAGLGLGGEPTGSAAVSVVDGLPVFAFPITGGVIDTVSGNALIQHAGSGVRLFALADPTISATVGNFFVNTTAGTVSGTVNGGANLVRLFDFGTPGTGGIPLLISTELAGALTAVFGAGDLRGAQFGLANTAPSPVPLPAALPLLVLGLGALGLVRRRRAVV